MHNSTIFMSMSHFFSICYINVRLSLIISIPTILLHYPDNMNFTCWSIKQANRFYGISHVLFSFSMLFILMIQSFKRFWIFLPNNDAKPAPLKCWNASVIFAKNMQMAKTRRLDSHKLFTRLCFPFAFPGFFNQKMCFVIFFPFLFSPKSHLATTLHRLVPGYSSKLERKKSSEGYANKLSFLKNNVAVYQG